jgi:hypothetical protein
MRRADHSSRGVLSTAMRRCVSTMNGEAKTRVGPQHHKKTVKLKTEGHHQKRTKTATRRKHKDMESKY